MTGKGVNSVVAAFPVAATDPAAACLPRARQAAKVKT